MIVGINCGHTVSGTVGSGAVGFLNESNETRRVGYKVMEYLRAKGVTVVDCTDDYSSTVSENLKKIVDKANAQPLDLFVSIHFNSGGGRGTGGGHRGHLPADYIQCQQHFKSQYERNYGGK